MTVKKLLPIYTTEENFMGYVNGSYESALGYEDDGYYAYFNGQISGGGYRACSCRVHFPNVIAGLGAAITEIQSVKLIVHFAYTRYGTGAMASTQDVKAYLNGDSVDYQQVNKDGTLLIEKIYTEKPGGGSWNGETSFPYMILTGYLYSYGTAEWLFIDIDYAWLEITYTPLELTVTTQAVTDEKDTHVTGNGNVTDDGGGHILERGFEYGTSEEAQFCVRQTGTDLGEGAYSLTIGGLKPETTYYYRAYATNEIGEGYGDWVSFTTNALPSYGIYEESNTATICFYVRRAGGKWSIKHGPYTEDQADIEIGKILTEGKGKYQIKFTSDVLTGLSVNIMTKLDIRAR